MGISRAADQFHDDRVDFGRGEIHTCGDEREESLFGLHQLSIGGHDAQGVAEQFRPLETLLGNLQMSRTFQAVIDGDSELMIVQPPLASAFGEQSQFALGKSAVGQRHGEQVLEALHTIHSETPVRTSSSDTGANRRRNAFSK